MEEHAHALLGTATKWGWFNPINTDVAVIQKPPFLLIRSRDVYCRDAYSVVVVILRRLREQGSYGGFFQVLNEDLRLLLRGDLWNTRPLEGGSRRTQEKSSRSWSLGPRPCLAESSGASISLWRGFGRSPLRSCCPKIEG